MAQVLTQMHVTKIDNATSPAATSQQTAYLLACQLLFIKPIPDQPLDDRYAYAP
jgi:hypothetical protein